MIKQILIIGIVLSIIAVFPAKAQKIEIIIDSLYVQLKRANSDTTRALLLAELSYRYYTVPDSALSLAKRGLDLSATMNYKRGIAANQASLGNYYSIIGEDVKAYSVLLKALEWQQLNGTAHEIGRTNFMLGFIASGHHDTEKALRHFKKAFFFFEKTKNPDMVLVLNNLGFMYTAMKNYDSAFYFLNKGLDFARSTKQPEFEAVLLQSMGETFFEKKDFDKATRFIQRSIELNKNFDKRIQSVNYLKLAQIFNATKQPERAILSAKTSLNIASEAQDLNQTELAARFLYDAYLEKQDHEQAIRYLKLASDAHDSIYSIEKNKEIQWLTKNFEVKEKEAEIKMLQQETSLQEIDIQLRNDTLKRQRFILLGLLIVLILLAILLTRYRMISRVKRELDIERIRNNISQDLHNDVGSALSIIKIISKQGIENETLELTHQNFSLIESHSSKIMGTMADIVWSINSNNDTMGKIVLYMKEFASEILEPQNIRYTFDISGDIDALKLEVMVRKNLFLIFKEAISNAAKYSGCTEIFINISFESRVLTLKIADNGSGFDFQQVKLGNGLNNMKERAGVINGQFELNSETGGGTHISITTAIT